MHNSFLGKGFVEVKYYNRTFHFPRYLIAMFCIVLSVLIVSTLVVLISFSKSAQEISSLRQQLAVERTINKSLAEEIQKSHDGIQKIVQQLTGNKSSKREIKVQSISSPVQLYGMLHSIELSLDIIEDYINRKVESVRTVVNLTKIYNNGAVSKGLIKLHIAESYPANHHPQNIQKASLAFNAFSRIDITSKAKSILLKSEGLNAISGAISKMPIEKPIKNGRFVSGFGKRFHPIHRYFRMHDGVDFVGRKGANILATADGVVEKAMYSRSYGNFVIIRHANNIKTLYAHMQKLNVQGGQRVKVGHVVGKQGTTGTSTGDHLHYEVMVNGQNYDPLNFIRTKAIIANVRP